MSTKPEYMSSLLMHKVTKLFFIPFLFAAIDAAVAAQTIEKQIDIGFYVSEGKYSKSEPTRIRYIPVTLRARKGKFFVKAATGWANIDGPGNIDTTTDNNAAPNRIIFNPQSGVGDTFFSAGYFFHVSSSNAIDFLSLEPKIKIPTADDSKNLGTGVIDYSLAATAIKTLGRFSYNATATYYWRKPTEKFTLRNTAAISFGSRLLVNSNVSLGASVNAQQAKTLTSGNSLDVTPYFSYNWSKQFSTLLYSQIGFASGSADYAVGIQNSVRF